MEFVKTVGISSSGSDEQATSTIRVRKYVRDKIFPMAVKPVTSFGILTSASKLFPGSIYFEWCKRKSWSVFLLYYPSDICLNFYLRTILYPVTIVRLFELSMLPFTLKGFP